MHFGREQHEGSQRPGHAVRPVVQRGPRARTRGQRAGRGVAQNAGQSLVEFALILVPLLLVMLGIIQFGFIFNAYVTMTNAAREAARTGTIYVYDPAKSKDQNDALRNDAIKTTLTGSMNLLSKTSPQFVTGGTWTSSNGGLTFTQGDVVVAYAIPSGITDNDPRRGEQVTVTANYHLDLIIPMVARLLPRDAGGRLGLSGAVTMVIN
jgi:Flp pilus assembly protein TadG